MPHFQVNYRTVDDEGNTRSKTLVVPADNPDKARETALQRLNDTHQRAIYQITSITTFKNDNLSFPLPLSHKGK